MKQTALDFNSSQNLSKRTSDKKKRMNSQGIVFRPPKFVHDFHYYTEVEKEWVQLGKQLED